MSWSVEGELAEISTPFAVVSLPQVEANTASMAARAERLGVQLRPHVKTHKCVEGAALQIRGGGAGLTVSTLAEARAFALAGFGDLLWAVPPSLGRVSEVFDLLSTPEIERLDVICDHPVTLEALIAEGGRRGATVGVWLEVDCGDGRGGLRPEGAAIEALARRVTEAPEVELRGVLTHGGQSYACVGAEAIRAVAEEERAAVVGCAERLRAAGIPVPGVSLGSTPTLALGVELQGVTEVRPGNYVFFDAFQAAIGSCTLDEVAFSVVATVLGRYPERGTLVIDAGALALSKDAGPIHVDPRCGYGVIMGEGGREAALRITSLSQEHGVITVEGGLGAESEDARWPVGSRLRIIPNHCCMSAALFDRYHVVDGGALVGTWSPVKYWSS